MIKNILITGATGNVGYETIRGLIEIQTVHHIIAGGSKPAKAETRLSNFEHLTCRKLNFIEPSTFGPALENIDIVFLCVLHNWQM